MQPLTSVLLNKKEKKNVLFAIPCQKTKCTIFILIVQSFFSHHCFLCITIFKNILHIFLNVEQKKSALFHLFQNVRKGRCKFVFLFKERFEHLVL